ncbi:VPLPA-CTERM sorting domain-containing protein [Methylotuvimicrobium sp.]|uniref:VPLPA-CTERM sorting domain-containing protein n=1 Tax=Methylotuvimicrobium sp. TaxID=2822413 RepID=UPI003D6541AD
MNLLSNKRLLGTATVVLAGFLQTAYAASSAHAQIDWNSLQVQYFDLSGDTNTPILSWSNESGEVHTHAHTGPNAYQNDYDDQWAYDFVTALSASAVTSEAQSNSLRDANTLSASASTQPGNWNNGYWNHARAWSENTVNFTLNGLGIALISLNWSTSVNGTLSDWSNRASSEVYISASYWDNNTTNGDVTTNFGAYTIDDGNFYYANTFTLALFSNGINPVQGNLKTAVFASSISEVSQIPVPAAFWMMGSALLGLLGVSRRKT